MAPPLEELKFVEVPSSNLWLAAYDGERLHVVFRTHQHVALLAVYSYEVPPQMVLALCLAPSHGSFFAKHIRGLPFQKRFISRSRLSWTRDLRAN